MDRTQKSKGQTAETQRLRAAEFFAGIGLVRTALERAEIDVVFANDIEPNKERLYAANHDEGDFLLRDVRSIAGAEIPDIDIATASFPCTDLSLAGNRAGLSGRESSMFWEFARILDEMNDRKPPVVLLENVPSFATSHGGRDLAEALSELNRLEYGVDILMLDASWFVPQSRPRLFVIGSRQLENIPIDVSTPNILRPEWLTRFISGNQDLRWHETSVPCPAPSNHTLDTIVERLKPDDKRWWDEERVERFRTSMSPLQADRLAAMQRCRSKRWATAYRRTRNGTAVWEIRPDFISGCLRTARGGSSRQALVEAARGQWRVRWMTSREFARLQGAGDYNLAGVSENQALFGFGDAVCVPAVAWIAQYSLRPLVESAGASNRSRSPAAAV